jgi:hypothetical protein
MLNDQQQSLRRCASREAVVLAIRQAWDVVAGIAQGVQLAAIGQNDWIVEGPGLAFVRHPLSLPRHGDARQPLKS